METFGTFVNAVDPVDGEIKKFVGQNIKAKNKEAAQEYCNNNGLGYLQVDEKLVSRPGLFAKLIRMLLNTMKS